ncbi:MAG: hypothetical protein ACI8TX_000260 [Hyphomicrobiaceae bacterium]|jgi:hypothetical protein
MSTTAKISFSRLAAASSILILLLTSSGAAAATCGQPVTAAESNASARDALFVLRSAVDLVGCRLCICDVDGNGRTNTTDALLALRNAVGLEIETSCRQCEESDVCPGVAQFALLAGTRGPCATNADCGGLGVCDPSIGRCVTASRLDNGWTGIAHGADPNDLVPARLFLDCEGPAPCGDCTIRDLDPSLGNCRCANDNRQVCLSPVEDDDTFCGGDRCDCYFGPPLPLSAGSAPTCVVNRLSEKPSGPVNVDEGSGNINLPITSLVHLGIANLAPCPFCENDTIPGDGNRQGVCVGGLNDGQSCDEQSGNTTFPAPDGGRHSLDCFPDPGSNISGAGLPVDLQLSTNGDQLGTSMPCAAGGPFSTVDCPCLVCSDDPRLACDGDMVCIDAGAGTCSSTGPSGRQPQSNNCDDGVCLDQGDGTGECSTGPDDRFCNGIVRANGRGIIACGTNIDCDATVIGIDAGECTLTERRPCFLDSIVAVGAAHPVLPLASDTYCLAPTSSSGINAVVGLPGPGRLQYQALLQLFCKGDPTRPYSPTAGGCP